MSLLGYVTRHLSLWLLQDRYWRKNREPNEGSVCVGTDLNRNWDANWSGEATIII